jgi:hypothetical protein
MPTPMRAATGMPTPSPTPRAVVLDFFSGSAAGAAVDVDEALVTGAEDPAVGTAVGTAVEALLEVDADTGALDVTAIEEAEEVCVCVNDSPMMVTVYTSAGDCAKVKISNPELALQSQPS